MLKRLNKSERRESAKTPKMTVHSRAMITVNVNVKGRLINRQLRKI